MTKRSRLSQYLLPVGIVIGVVLIVLMAYRFTSPAPPAAVGIDSPSTATSLPTAAPTAVPGAQVQTQMPPETPTQPAPTEAIQTVTPGEVLSQPTPTPEGTSDLPTPTAEDSSPTPEATLAQPTPVAERITPTPDFTGYDVEMWFERSPDGLWEVIGLVAFPAGGAGESYYTRLDVLSLVGVESWTPVDQWAPIGLGYTTPRILSWSTDGDYLYLTNRPVPDGCAIYVNGSDVQRMTLLTGQVETLVPSVGLWLALSPDETRLAYIGYGGRGLVVRDLASGVERETGLDPGTAYAAGDIVWAPDGSAVVLGLGISPCAGGFAAGVSLVRVDLPSLAQTELLAADERLFRIRVWMENGIQLEDRDEQIWLMDPTTGALTFEG